MLFGPKGPFCQSCGMPLSRDSKGGGTNADGKTSTEYCSHCYQNGKFTNLNVSLDEMKVIVKGKMKEMGFPGFIANFFIKDMGKLNRWQTKN